MAQEWNNFDNLYLRYGADKAIVSKAGEYETEGQIREVEVKIDLTTLTETETVLDPNQVIPSGVRIAQVEVRCHTAAATGTAIDVGLARRVTAGATTLTEVDYNGILAAYATASMDAAGETNTYNVGTGGAGTGGALIGATTASTALITASRTDATAFTAGVVYIKIRYYRP